MKRNWTHYLWGLLCLMVLPLTLAAQSNESIFTTEVPGTYANDAVYELGTKFKTTGTGGQITGVRIYTNNVEGGIHKIRIWRVSDATVVVGPIDWNITAGTEGWKEFTLPVPYSVTPNVDYIISVSTSSDQWYSSTAGGFNDPIERGHLVTYAASGVYATTLGDMPVSVSGNRNYFRDIIFVSSDPVPEPELDSSRIGLFDLEDVPQSISSNEPAAVELGMKFKTNLDGRITGVRFYKAGNNTGLHTGSLWSAKGLLLRRGTFKNETASGWQELTFDKPYKAKAGTKYIVSYHTKSGNYSSDSNYFELHRGRGHIIGLASDSAGTEGNGVYKYSPTPSFPQIGASNQNNYWVDITFAAGSGGQDSIAPSKPGLLHVTSTASNSITLSWTASTDNNGVWGYLLFRNGSESPFDTAWTTSYTNTGLAAGATYYYTVRAIDTLENVSAASNVATGTTLQGGTVQNKALLFDGVDDALAVYNNANYPFWDFTFETWLKVTPGTVGTVMGNSIGFQYSVSDRDVLFNTQVGKVAFNTPPNDTGWVYFAFVRQADTLRAYRNGELVAVNDTLVQDSVLFENSWIGAIVNDSLAGSHHNFAGAIDEFRISNIALSAEDILDNWNGGNGKFLRTDAHTVSNWHFNEGKEALVYDYSQNGREGMFKPAYGSNQPSWILGKTFPDVSIADFEVFTPDFHSRIGVRPFVAISGAASGDKFIAKLDGTQVWQEVGNLPLRLRFPVDLRSLGAGDHKFTWELRSSTNELLQKDSTLFNKPVSGIPRSAIDEDNAPVVAGERIPFVLAPFIANPDWVDSTNAGWLDYEPMAITALFSKGYGFDSEEFTKHMWDDHGLYSIQGDDTSNIPMYVNKLKNLPGFLMYTWMDEPDLAGVRANRIRAWTDLSHSLDPQHPVVVNLQGASAEREDAPNWMYRSRGYFYPHHITDVRMFDYYPTAMTDRLAENITLEQAFANLATVCDNYRYWSYDQEPIWSFVQPNQFRNDTGMVTPPAPDSSELRATYWINIVHGVKGIGWFPHFVKTPPENFKVMSELTDKTLRLQDVIYAPEREDAVTEQELGGGRIDISSKVLNNKLYIFAVNMKDENQSVRFRINIPPTGNAAVVFDEHRNIALDGSSFTDNFKRYETHIYTIEDSVVVSEYLAKTAKEEEKAVVVEGDGVTVSPNPSSNMVLIRPEPGVIVYSVDVYDIKGALHRSIPQIKETGGTISIELGNFTRGIYLLKMRTNKGEKVKKLIKL